MAAPSAAFKKVAVALPFAILEVNGVRIIITINSHRERFKVDSVAFLSITLGLRDLTDQSIIHFILLPPFLVFTHNKRHARGACLYRSSINIPLKETSLIMVFPSGNFSIRNVWLKVNQ